MNAIDRVLELINQNPQGLTAQEICEMLSLARNTVGNAISALQQRGKIDSFKRGVQYFWQAVGVRCDINNQAPEYLKVSSIWRVAQRYASQVQA